jgi:hypothetical protein
MNSRGADDEHERARFHRWEKRTELVGEAAVRAH